MFFYLSKITFFLLHPGTWVFAVLLWAWICKQPIKRKRLLLVGIGLFYFFSNKFIADEVARAWESKVVLRENLHAPYDAIVLLGGFTTFDTQRNITGFHESADRMLYALQLYKQGMAPAILVSGGNARLVEDKTEAEIVGAYLHSLGVPDSALWLEKNSRNTLENAVYSAQVLEEKKVAGRILLLTSAYHMPRAEACFKKAGIETEIYPVDFISGPRKYYPDHLFLPDMQSFIIWQQLLHEWVGYGTYKLLGKV